MTDTFGPNKVRACVSRFVRGFDMCSRSGSAWSVLIASPALVMVAACGDTPRPVAPSQAPPPAIAASAPDSAHDVSGVVYESTATGRRPLAGVVIDVSVEYQSWPAKVSTDADGRFRWGAYVGAGKLIAEKPGYSQPCRVPVTPRLEEYEVYLVANETLSSTGVPWSLPLVEPVLRGLVFERTPQGSMQPIAGADVTLDFTGGMGWAPSARTKTDRGGRYLLCNVVEKATPFGVSALVSKAGFETVFVPVTLNAADVELHRR